MKGGWSAPPQASLDSELDDESDAQQADIVAANTCNTVVAGVCDAATKLVGEFPVVAETKQTTCSTGTSATNSGRAACKQADVHLRAEGVSTNADKQPIGARGQAGTYESRIIKTRGFLRGSAGVRKCGSTYPCECRASGSSTDVGQLRVKIFR